MNKMVISAIIALLTILMAACVGSQEASVTVPPGAQAGDLVGLEPCSYTLKTSMFSSVEYPADCSTLVVPENRADPNSRLIAGARHSHPSYRRQSRRADFQASWRTGPKQYYGVLPNAVVY